MINNNILTIILIIINIYILILIYTIYSYTFHNINYLNCKNNLLINHKYYDNIKDNIKSGDLILFIGYDKYSISRLYYNILFQHYGIIVQINKKFYILECTNDMLLNNNIYKNNVYCTEFEYRLLHYSGILLISHIKNKLSFLQEEKLKKIANKCIKYSNNNDIYTYLSNCRMFLHFYHNINFNKKYSCISFIHYILYNKLNIIKINAKPCDLPKLYHNIVLSNNIYNYPYEIIHNNLYTNKIQNQNVITYDNII